jgi:hypothetical protein
MKASGTEPEDLTTVILLTWFDDCGRKLTVWVTTKEVNGSSAEANHLGIDFYESGF